ncbi:putative serine/threonine protein phosphatase [Enterococcus phage ECP3]|uniref:Serine/threonine protein phosphatase n=1 Tax=Enterococcus phage ECP3 TaxID=1498168 RepID=A0A096XT93_9CAUD|nr:phosphoesterase [Enterococcus phage ECP3]AII28520.1 putative serine/threonine protein phosphatase [Enterococcus phage ECP3]
MKDKVFIVSDIHGCYDELIMLLNKHWNSDEEDLILLGDYVDRGSKSAEVLGFVYKHILNGGTALLGNHDQMLLDFLTFPLIREADYEDLSEMYAMWMYNGGDKTISSLLDLGEHLQDAFTTRKMLLEKQM